MYRREVKMKKSLGLIAYYNPELVENLLLSEIAENCRKYGIMYPDAYEFFQQNKYAENSLYFHCSYAESDIPIGEEYEKIALRKDFKSEPQFIQDCRAKVLCFFIAFRPQPADYAAQGHHELSLIQFPQGIPQIIYEELYEIKELKPLQLKKTIYLYSE